MRIIQEMITAVFENQRLLAIEYRGRYTPAVEIPSVGPLSKITQVPGGYRVVFHPPWRKDNILYLFGCHGSSLALGHDPFEFYTMGFRKD